MMEWKILDHKNLPSDILTWVISGDNKTHEVQYLSTFANSWKRSRAEDIFDLLKTVFLRSYRYRKIQKQPSHVEIMTKWWKYNSVWYKVIAYDEFEKYYMIDDYWLGKDLFKDLESSDMPPE